MLSSHSSATRRLGTLSTVVMAATAAVVMACAAGQPALADQSADEQAIRTASATYKAALEQGDGKKLTAIWLPDGDIIDATGEVLPGRSTVEMLEPAAPGTPPAVKPVLTFDKTTIRFVTPDVAIEDGVVKALPPGSAVPIHGRFAAIWARHEGGWKLAAIRESKTDRPVGSEVLADLDWMIGDWSVADASAAASTGERPTIDVSARWNKPKTYLIRDMTITPPGGSDDAAIRVTQRIGWDPLSKTIHSWVFSSDGGHGEATWHRDGDSWVAQTTAVLADGSQTSSLNIYTFDGKDRCKWQSIHTHIGGEHMPQIDMTMVRKPATGTTGGAR